MTSAELRVALHHPLMVLRHPSWWSSFVRHGRQGVVRRIVAEDLSKVRQWPAPVDLQEVTSRQPIGVLAKIGSPQEYLYFLTRWLRPNKVVETGVDRGLSTAFILAALRDNGRGHLFSIDLPTASYVDPLTGTTAVSNVGSKTAPGFVVPPDLRSSWSLILGDSRVELPRLLNQVGLIDLFVHDSEHTFQAMSEEYRIAMAHLRPGGILASDDVNWNDAFQRTVSQVSFDFSAIVLGRLGVARLRANLKAGGEA
jgi:predicted O-methyltransferase YrrM